MQFSLKQGFLASNFQTPLGKSVEDPHIILHFLKAGALVDVSHMSPAAFSDTVRIAARYKAPIVATHSNARAIADHPRNLSDDQLKALRDNDGVIGAVFCTPFLDKGCAAALTRLRRSGGRTPTPLPLPLRPMSSR